MEGWLMKKGWFNNWKMRHVVCSDHKLTLSKSLTDEKGSMTFNVMDCTIKRYDAKRWNRKFVFRIKIGSKKIYLAAEDENNCVKWINAIRGRVQRASLLGANALRCAENGKRRSSPMASLSRTDMTKLMMFSYDKLANIMKDAIEKPEDPQAQYQFAEVCGEFLSIAHSQSQSLFGLTTSQPIDGITATFVDKNERSKKKKQMKALLALLEKKSPGVYVPLQCIIDFSGRSIFFETKINGNKSLSASNTELLFSLGIASESLNTIQDDKGRLWITNAEGLYSPAKQSDLVAFVKELDTVSTFVFDSQSLIEATKLRKIPVYKLSKLIELTNIPGVRAMLQTEVIARAAKDIIIEAMSTISADARKPCIIEMFNLILGQSNEADQFWEKTLIPKIKAKFSLVLDRDIPMLHIPQLFFSMQFHTGADFADTASFNFKQQRPLSLEDLNDIHAVPHHFLVEMAKSTRNLTEDPYKQFSKGLFSEASLMYNSLVSIYQSIFGDENIYVASGLSHLSTTYLGMGDVDKAEMCARGALAAGRTIHAALIPSYISLISMSSSEDIDQLLSESRKIVGFHLGELHWMQADVMSAAAIACVEHEDFNRAAQFAQNGLDIVLPLLGADHPKSARTLLLKGKIMRSLKKYALARPLIEQALYSMRAAFGEESVQTSECLFELADTLLDSGSTDDALVAAKKSISIRQNLFNDGFAAVVESVQQIALISDALNHYQEAFEYYGRLLGFLKSLEDETVFKDVVMVIRNVLCLYFRSIGSTHRQLFNQLKRRQIPGGNDVFIEVFQKLLDGDPVDEASTLMAEYQRSGNTTAFDELAALYHIATDELDTLVWLDIQ